MIESIIENTDANISDFAQKQLFCRRCTVELCSREKIINLAAGQIEIMYCLVCLGKRDGVPAKQFLGKMRKYILARQCFQKEWLKYKDQSICINRQNCLAHKEG